MDTIDKILKMIESANIGDFPLERQLGLAQGTIKNWRAHKNKPSADALAKIADYFDVSVDYLLGRTEVPKPDYVIPPELEKIPIAFYQGLKDLNQEEIDTVNTIVQAFIAKKKK